jgi:predicted phage gp36 major capsid-like protein
MLEADFDRVLSDLAALKARIDSDLGNGKLQGNVNRQIENLSDRVNTARTEFTTALDALKSAASQKDRENFEKLTESMARMKDEINAEFRELRKIAESNAASVAAIDIDLRGDKTEVNPGLLYLTKQLTDWYQRLDAQGKLVLGAAGLILTVAGYIFSTNIEGRISTNAGNISQNNDVIARQETAIAVLDSRVKALEKALEAQKK